MPFSRLKTDLRNQSGFISIVALAMLCVMIYVMISVQMQVVNRLDEVKSFRNYSSARYISESIMQFVQWKMKNHDVGWNLEKIRCGYGKFADKTTMIGEAPADFCTHEGLLYMVTPQEEGEAQRDILFTMEVKGHSAEDENIMTDKCGTFGSSCYVIPDPGTGDAGDETYCSMYDVVPENSTKPDAKATIPSDLANGKSDLDQLNYSCNWNKLSFGSSYFDRVTVPLYYDNSGIEDGSKMVQTFHENTSLGQKGSNLTVRLRTPCVPCGGILPNGKPRDCGDKRVIRDETVCDSDERYVLDVDYDESTDDDDVVVQWQLNGKCDDGKGKGELEDCGVIAIKDKERVKWPGKYSAFYESKINENTTLNFEIFKNDSLGYDNNNFPEIVALLSSVNRFVKLPTMTNAVLSFSLNKPLLTQFKKNNIPYLEYQILTDKPVSSPRAFLKVNVVVGDNGYTRTLSIEVPKPLIDFAIHTN